MCGSSIAAACRGLLVYLYRVRVFFFFSIATNMKEAKPGSVMFKNYLIFVGTRILRRLHFFCTVRHGGV